MSILISSFGKCFAILPMIWEYDLSVVTLVNVFVLSSHVTALKGNQLLFCVRDQSNH